MASTQPTDLQALLDQLQALHTRTLSTPLFNPVFQLGFDLSKSLEDGQLTLGGIADIAKALETNAFTERSQRLRSYVAPVSEADNDTRLEDLLSASSSNRTFDQFAAFWGKPKLACVFTGHPTFMLTTDSYRALAEAATGEGTPDPALAAVADRPEITIEDEHRQAMAALGRAHQASLRISGQILRHAQQAYPDHWRAMKPCAVSFGTWVGYDMDGRTDISWQTSLSFRLVEKQQQLDLYCKELSAIIGLAGETPDREQLADALRTLESARDHTGRMISLFNEDLGQPAELSRAANLMTADDEGRLTSLSGVRATLAGCIERLDDEAARKLIALIGLMDATGLGMGTVHFRINASQLQNAVRRRLDDDEALDVSSRSALVRLRQLMDTQTSLPVNFAALAIENTTAVRQFLAMAQILKHIDEDSAIRLLIAECEQPVTVLAALFFARLFGIDDNIDVSPLFETETALEHGARLLDAVLSERHFRDYARRRGRVAIQTGFSDAGRFLGQIPAALAIERLQGRLAELMKRHGLLDVSALIFNTHGESMGRGGHPMSVTDRLAHVMSPWARTQFASRAIPLEQEASFQGGDGFVFFGTQPLALATLTRVLEAQVELDALDGNDDPFYEDVDQSLDFYRSVRRQQTAMFSDTHYVHALLAFGLSLLRKTGSRKSRRQSDVMQERDISLRRIRAIPHNAVLQQLGYPVNVLYGIGTAVQSDVDGFLDLLQRSHRARGLLRMLTTSKALASIKALVAYGELYNGAFWSTRPYLNQEPELADACLDLADRLTNDDRTPSFRRLATRLRVDSVKLHRLLDRMPDDLFPDTQPETRRTLGLLHALRLALLQHMFLKAVQIPPFSQRNDISRDDILEMIFELRVEEALELLQVAYPVDGPSIADFEMDEETAYPDDRRTEYSRIHANFIDPIRQSYDIILGLGTAISNYFGAHG